MTLVRIQLGPFFPPLADTSPPPRLPFRAPWKIHKGDVGEPLAKPISARLAEAQREFVGSRLYLARVRCVRIVRVMQNVGFRLEREAGCADLLLDRRRVDPV